MKKKQQETPRGFVASLPSECRLRCNSPSNQIGTSLETFLEKRARVDVLQREQLISEVLLYVQEKTPTARRASAFVVVENRTS